MASATNSISTFPSSSPPRTIAVFCGASSGSSPAHLSAARALGTALATHKIKLVYGAGTSGMMGEVARTVCELAGADFVHGIIPKALMPKEMETGERESRDAGSTTTGSNKSGIGADGEVIGLEAAKARDDATTSTATTTSADVGVKSLNSSAAQQDKKEFQFLGGAYGKTTIVPSMHARKALMCTEVSAGGPGSGFIALSGGFGTIEEIMEMTTWNQLSIHDVGLVLFNVEGFWDGLVEWIRKAVEQGFIRESCREILKMESSAEACLRALGGYRCVEGRMRLSWGEK